MQPVCFALTVYSLWCPVVPNAQYHLAYAPTRVAGQLNVGSWDPSGVVMSIPTGATDTTGGALPEGSIRWRNAGTLADGRSIDLRVSIPDTPLEYSDNTTNSRLSINYVSPVSFPPWRKPLRPASATLASGSASSKQLVRQVHRWIPSRPRARLARHSSAARTSSSS